MKWHPILIFLCVQFSGHAQPYIQPLLDSTPNFYEVYNQFEEYWQSRPVEKGRGYKQFRRWADFMEPRVYPSGDFPNPMNAWNACFSKSGSFPKATANWTQFMTHDTLSFTPFSTIPGHGRVTVVKVHPTDSTILFVGTPSGGMWKSTNSGASWTPVTDELPVIGVSDILINPDNPQEMYIATGDNNMINTYSIGVLKTTDGGSTWNTTGLNYQVSQTINIRRMAMHPVHPDTLWAGTNNGLFRSNDGGDSWSQIMPGSIRDIEFHPNDPSIVFLTTSGGFYKSTDGGASFVSSGLSENSAISRMELAVAPSNPDIIYVIAADANSSGLYAFYRSNDGGNSFGQTANTTNILGYFQNGGTGGQAWFDMDVTVSPNDENEVFTAGINIWKTTDGGSSFSPTSDWSNPYANTYVHGDVHRVIFQGNRLYTTCDGGLFYSDDFGSSWTDISSNLSIHQIYSFAQSSFDENHMLAGMQDVGSSYYDGDKWTTVTWGDGFDCQFDPFDSQKMYTSAHLGQFFRTSTGINGFQQYFHGISETSAFRSVIRRDPNDANTFYLGFQNVWKSIDGTQSWSPISNFGNNFPLQRLEISPGNSDVIYATSNFLAYRTDDAGVTWNQITPGLPTNFAAISHLHIDPFDSARVWVTFSGYVGGQKVYFSENGGSTWTNISGNLPNLPVNCIVTEGSAQNGIYVGTDVGVYYKNDTLNNWISFNTGLPNVIVNDLLILSGGSVIRAATFGRGVWESPLFADELLVSTPTISADEEDPFSLYPNPAVDQVTISVSSENFQPTSSKIVDSKGRELLTKPWKSGSKSQSIDTNILPAGIYTCIIQNEKYESLSRTLQIIR